MEQTAEVKAPRPTPKTSVPLRRRIPALRGFHTGAELFRDADGPVVLVRVGPKAAGGHFVFVTSPQGIHDVLAGSDGSIDKEMNVHRESRAWGLNVFNLPHEPWLTRRRTLQPIFTKRHVAGYASQVIQAAESIAVPWSRDEPASVDLDRAMRQLTLRGIGLAVFGLDLGERAIDLEAHINNALRWTTNRAAAPVRAPGWLPTPARHRFRTSLATINAVLDEAIAGCRSGTSPEADLIRKLLDTPDEHTGQPLTDAQIRAELFVFALAGHDTTATTLTYSLWQLGLHPEIQDRVAAEVRALGERPLTVEDAASLGYTSQVLHEALRLCPPAAGVGRMAMRDVIIDGYLVPEGSNIVVGIYAVHRDPELWESPTTFDPDRFAAERRHTVERWQYLPFGAGPRSCIGDHFAMLEATLALATLVRSCRIESLNDDFPMALPFTLTAGAPIPIRVRRR
ncbi:MAG: cytochrome P450 [Marmoricola sp.]